MIRKAVLTIAALVIVTSAAPALAQSTASTSGAIVAVQGGGFTAAANLNDAGTADFKTGFNAGIAAGYQINSNLAVLGTVTFVRSETRGTALPEMIAEGAKTNRYLYGAELQVKAPLGGGVSPYLIVGGGAVTFQTDDPDMRHTFTKPAGKIGAGLSLELPGSNVSAFVEGAGWAYQFDRFGFDKTQFDITWSAGLSYRFGR